MGNRPSSSSGSYSREKREDDVIESSSQRPRPLANDPDTGHDSEYADVIESSSIVAPFTESPQMYRLSGHEPSVHTMTASREPTSSTSQETSDTEAHIQKDSENDDEADIEAKSRYTASTPDKETVERDQASLPDELDTKTTEHTAGNTGKSSSAVSVSTDDFAFLDQGSEDSQRSETSRENPCEATTRDHYMKFAFLEVGVDGGWFTIPDIGVEMMIPSGALEETVTLKVSIVNFMESFPQSARRWSRLGPRVRIEPENVVYRKPVYLSIKHNLQTILSKAPDRQYPLMLHRHKADAPWTIIPCTEKQCADNSSGQIHGFQLCTEKQAVLTSSAVVVAMLTNCEHCLCFPDDDPRAKVMRMSVRLYADYQQDGGLLNVRAYAIHDTPDRIMEIGMSERDELGGHLLGKAVVFFDRNHQDLTIDLRVSADGQQIDHQMGNVNYDLLCLELDQRTGTSTGHSFGAIKINAGAAAARPSSVQIEAKISQCQVRGPHNITVARDLQQLSQTPSQVPSELMMHKAGARGQAAYHNYMFGAAPVVISGQSQLRDSIVTVLQQHLSDHEVQKIRRYVKIQDRGNDGRPNVDTLVMNMFVGNSCVETVIEDLRALGIERDGMEQQLQNL